MAALSFPAAFAAPPRDAAARSGIRPDALYHNYCSVCHGDRGDGRSRARNSLVPPPKDFTDPAVHGVLTRDYMIAIVREGKRGTAMVGWKTQLNDAEIAAVVDYVRTEFMRGAAAPLAATVPPAISGISAHGGRQRDALPAVLPASTGPLADMTLPMPRQLLGDAKRGAKTYYANCATCHGTLGDGNGPRAYFIVPRPRNFLQPASRDSLNKPALFSAIYMGRPGTEMPAWSKVLNDQQVADVAEFVFTQFIGAPQDGRASRGK